MLVLSGRPSEAQAQVRYLGHRGHSRHLSVLRTLNGAFTNLTLPASGVVEVSVRYIDPYDMERASPWTTLKTPPTATKTAKGRHSSMRRRGIVLGAVLGSFASLLPSSALATTGSYEVSACNYAPEAVNNSWTWTTTDPSQPDHYAEHANCPYRLGGNGGTVDQEGGLSTTDALGLSSGAPPGTSAGWTFTAPAGTTIAAINYERYIGHQIDPINYWSPALRADGTVVSGRNLLWTRRKTARPASLAGHPAREANQASITGLSAHQLSLGVVCQAPPAMNASPVPRSIKCGPRCTARR